LQHLLSSSPTFGQRINVPEIHLGRLSRLVQGRQHVGVARQAVGKKGEQNKRRPICSSRIASSTNPTTNPPYR
jgi:hypothetical protein